jgi:hypothetical protein
MKFFLIYVSIVGTLLIGIVCVLWIGSHLVAPAAIGGVWKMNSYPQSEVGIDCASGLDWTDQTTLTVDQSGKFVELTVNNEVPSLLAGTVQDLTVTALASSANRRSEPAVQIGEVSQLSADIQRDEDSEQLIGTLVIEGCAESLPFVATDRTPTEHQTSGGGH